MHYNLLLNYRMILSSAYWVCVKKCWSLPREKAVIMMKTCFTGFRNNNSRIDVHHVLKGTNISDEKLLHIVFETVLKDSRWH